MPESINDISSLKKILAFELGGAGVLPSADDVTYLKEGVVALPQLGRLTGLGSGVP
jgi:hypothetical protein